MQFLFVQSGFPLELPFPRFVTSPQLFFRSGIPHHRGSARTFTAVRISRRSYTKAPQVKHPWGERRTNGTKNLSDADDAQLVAETLAALPPGSVLHLANSSAVRYAQLVARAEHGALRAAHGHHDTPPMQRPQERRFIFALPAI